MNGSIRNRNAAILTAILLALSLFAPGAVAVVFAAVKAAGTAFVVGETTTTVDLSAAMKILFEDTIVNNVVTDSELVDLFEEAGGIKTDPTTGGRYIETAQLFNLPAGVGARLEGGYIPVPRGPKIVNGRIDLKKVMGSVEITGEVLKKVRTNRGAFIDWGEQQMPKLVERLTNELDRMLLGYGLGVKARVAAINGNTLTVDRAFGVDGFGGALFQFLAGETIRAAPDVSGTGIRAGKMVVEDVDHKNNCIVVNQVVAGLQVGDYLFEGDEADHSLNKEPMGLLGIVDDGSILAVFQNIPRANYSAWRAFVQDAQAAPFSAGQKLTEDLLIYVDDECFQRGGGKPDVIVCSRAGARQYWQDLKSDRTLNDPRGYMGGRGSPVGIFLGDRTVPLRVARKCPPEVAFGVTRKVLRKWMIHAFEWDDTTGSIFRQVTDSTGRKDAFYAYGTMYLECGSDDPQKCWRIQNLAV